MMKKRAIGWLLVLCLSLSLLAPNTFAGEAAPVVIGISNPPTGNMGLGLWSDNTTDIDLRLLLHGYETVSYTRSLGVAFNQTVLLSVQEEPQPDGDDVVVFEMAPGLAYNNGEAITARDYVFSLLLLASPELAALGAKPPRLEYLRGYDAYRDGATSVLAGVRLLSDTSFSLRVKAESLPNFYGFARLRVQPYPISVIAPGCQVADDGQGAYLKDAASAAEGAGEGQRYTPGRFSTKMLEATLLDPTDGYVANPRVTCGPYQLEAYDAAAHTVSLRANPRFIGNYEGKKPTVERLVARYARNEEMIPLLRNGELDIATRVGDSDAIRQGQALADENAGIRVAGYPRTGLTALAFACERGPLASPDVRRAVALCLDKDEVTRAVGGEFAQRVYGYYGKDQWMPEHAADPDGVTAPLNMPQELARLDIPQDLDAAKALLEADRWVLNAEGNPFQEGVDPMRYRNEEGRLVPLLLWMAMVEESAAALRFRDMLEASLSRAGIGLRSVQMPFADTLAQFYRQQERMFDLFFLANNFDFLYDPHYEENPDEASLGIANKTAIQDEALDALARDMDATPAFDRDGYAVKWLAFQRRYMEDLPMLPLYSSPYFDFYADRVQGYEVDQYSGWALSVPYARAK